jgi:hypothetical protein
LIEHVDARLQQWAGTVVGPSVEVSLSPPRNDPKDSGVSLFLMEMVGQPPMRGAQRSPLQFAVRYLVTVWAGDPVAEHRLLGDLVVAAMQVEDFEVELVPLAAATWTALSATARPSFVLRVPVRQARPEPAAKPVRQPLVVRGGSIARLSGVLLGPGDVPIASARVEIPDIAAATETDWQGRFLFPGVPAEPARKRLLVRARGQELEVEIVQPPSDEAVVIRFDHLLEA